MSSHREAPEISKDPVADNTDTYAFVSPDRPDTVTIITNYLPAESPAAGPNFYEFGNDVLYEIHIDNDGDGKPEITYQFRFETHLRNEDTFLYNTGQILSLDSPNWNRRQFYSVTRVAGGNATTLGEGLACPPCNIGPRSTPNYASLGAAAVHKLDSTTVFAGQRDDGFFVDLGSIFDLGDLRPFQNLHLIPTPAAPGVDTLANANVHTIAIQVPKTDLTRDGWKPTDSKDPRAVIGVYGSASRQKVRVRLEADDVSSGPWTQVSRLANPLFNEVIVPMAAKDRWNSLPPSADSEFAKYVKQPELARLLPVLYPGVFPNLAALKADRADLVAILLTGIPAGLIPGFQNFTGPTLADLLRLNLAIPPAANPNALGLLGGDLAGFPNGRRVQDDIVAIELRAVAGVTYPLIDPKFKPDGAAGLLTDGTSSANNGAPFLSHFPYLGVALDGYDHPSK
ncbi:MAG: DUF4331 domain-containing protein [Candidatus Dormibacteraeota bacterium]|nr:DUF4331 domain-containing protein [Candidatus Dormibacteraeota bacterium]